MLADHNGNVIFSDKICGRIFEKGSNGSCVVKDPFPIGSGADLRQLNEDGRCHRKTEKPIFT